MLLQPYNPQWADDFQAIQSLLADAMQNLGISVEHVGSTAIPGLAAKPILDIDLVYRDNDDFPELRRRLESLGYRHVGNQGIEDREVFKRNRDHPLHPLLDDVSHHLYACPAGSEELARHLRFRDLLRVHASIREAYQALKLEIAAAAGQDRKRYAEMKESVARPHIESWLESRTSSDA